MVKSRHTGQERRRSTNVDSPSYGVNGELPLISSAQLIRVLERRGFEAKKKGRGSHRCFVKHEDDTTLIVVVVLGKRELPRGLLRSILGQANISIQELLDELR